MIEEKIWLIFETREIKVYLIAKDSGWYFEIHLYDSTTKQHLVVRYPTHYIVDLIYRCKRELDRVEQENSQVSYKHVDIYTGRVAE